jgi:hypothetical protein
MVLYALVTGLMSAAWLPVFPYLRRHPELLRPGVELGNIAAQVRRPIVGVVSYALAALTGWFIHPLCAIAFLFSWSPTTLEPARVSVPGGKISRMKSTGNLWSKHFLAPFIIQYEMIRH